MPKFKQYGDTDIVKAERINRRIGAATKLRKAEMANRKARKKMKMKATKIFRYIKPEK